MTTVHECKVKLSASFIVYGVLWQSLEYYPNMSNFRPLEVVGRGSETQLQAGEKITYLI